jgi:CDP-diacylglycerol--glycerol-3-phosphate 3-phosphatidyltransferase
VGSHAAAKPLITANQVTFARIVTMPLMVWLFYQGATGQWWAFGLGSLIAMTDFVDGFLARKYGPTTLGGLMDPIADKVFIAVVFLPPVHLGWFPAWPIAVMFTRELLVTALRTTYELRGIGLKTSYLAKVKTWMQMQGAATMIFFALMHDRDVLWTMLIIATIVPLPALIAFAVIKRRLWKGALIMFGLGCFLDVLVWQTAMPDTIYIMCIILALATWGSGVDYFVAGMRELKGRGDLGRSDVVRIVGALAIPALVIATIVETDAPMWVPTAILCLELAVGGLDNLLAHHNASSGAAAWSARSLGAAALLGAILLASQQGHTDLVDPLAYAAIAVSIIGVAREFYRGRTHYIDALM